MIDLLLGGDLGIWFLENNSLDDVRQVFTFDTEITQSARMKGLKAVNDDINNVDLGTSQLGFSVHYPKILKEHVIKNYNRLYNVHPSYLPWGRGYYPVFWAIWEQTPAGATLHEINSGIDKGDIIDQIEVKQFNDDTGYTLFCRVRDAEKSLIRTYWTLMQQNSMPSGHPTQGAGSYHSKKAFEEIKTGNQWQTLPYPDLLRLLRALSFPGYTGLELNIGKKRFDLKMEPLEDSQ